MLPSKKDTQIRDFFSLYSGNTNGVYLPEIHKKWCCGSSEGWLVIVDECTEEIFLLNPFSRAKIQLPSLSTFSDPQDSSDPERPRNYHFIVKAILSSNPDTTSKYVVMAIVCNRQKLWNTLTTRWDPYEEIIYSNGLFYALSNQGPVVTVDINSDPISVTEIAPSVAEPILTDRFYLVESLGDLLLVSRILEWQEEDDRPLPAYKTVQFEAYRLDRMKIKSIGDQMLFLGDNCSISLSSRYFPECCRGDSIYFNDDYYEGYFNSPSGCHDMGVFNLADGSIKSFYKDPPIWVTPTIWVTPQPW
uniref:KIB1-4 beta-propeller domain-containing protein n=1 Tax=Nelumbo nucifera TaxID=4432 RepID=A0A822XTX1_NELNU|nr:TPA_asm: hypothetical protein HUJ06_022351 [Nelumbo nucifera]